MSASGSPRASPLLLYARAIRHPMMAAVGCFCGTGGLGSGSTVSGGACIRCSVALERCLVADSPQAMVL